MAVPADKLEDALQNMVKKITSNSVQSIQAYKQLFNKNESMSLDDALNLEFSSEFEIAYTEERLGRFKK